MHVVLGMVVPLLVHLSLWGLIVVVVCCNRAEPVQRSFQHTATTKQQPRCHSRIFLTISAGSGNKGKKIF